MAKKSTKKRDVQKRHLRKNAKNKKKRESYKYKGQAKDSPVKVKPLPLEQVVDLSFATFAEGINSYFESEETPNKKSFIESQGRGFNFNSGMRAYLSEEGLKISPPISWRPKSENPTVGDYVREIYDSSIEEMQLNCFNFLLCPEEDEEGFKPLASCIISSSPNPVEEGSAYLVLREIEYDQEKDEIMIMKKFFAGEDYTSDLSVLSMGLEPLKREEENVEP
jgi:hypothetical protein